MGKSQITVGPCSHNKKWPVGLIQLKQVAILVVTIWLKGSIPRKGILSTVT